MSDVIYEWAIPTPAGSVCVNTHGILKEGRKTHTHTLSLSFPRLVEEGEVTQYAHGTPQWGQRCTHNGSCSQGDPARARHAAAPAMSYNTSTPYTHLYTPCYTKSSLARLSHVTRAHRLPLSERERERQRQSERERERMRQKGVPIIHSGKLGWSLLVG